MSTNAGVGTMTLLGKNNLSFGLLFRVQLQRNRLYHEKSLPRKLVRKFEGVPYERSWNKTMERIILKRRHGIHFNFAAFSVTSEGMSWKCQWMCRSDPQKCPSNCQVILERSPWVTLEGCLPREAPNLSRNGYEHLAMRIGRVLRTHKLNFPANIHTEILPPKRKWEVNKRLKVTDGLKGGLGLELWVVQQLIKFIVFWHLRGFFWGFSLLSWVFSCWYTSG